MYTGPKLRTNGLRNVVDASNVKSFRGEPTTNLVPSGQRTCSTLFTRNGFHRETWDYSLETNVFGRSNVIKISISPSGTTGQPYADFGFSASKSGNSVVGDVYTVSFDYKVTQNTTTPFLNIVYADGYKSPNSSNAATLSSITEVDLGDGWVRSIRTATITIAGDTWWRFTMNSDNNDTEFYVDNFQVELKSYSTPFVDGTRGSTVATGGGWADLSGNGVHGELENGVRYFSDNNGILSLDGSDDRINLGNSIQLIDDQTLSFWVYPKRRDRRQNWYNQAYGGEGTITYEPNGALNYFYGTAGSNANPYQGFGTSGTPLSTLNRWYHVCLVRDLTNTTLRWYINGELNRSVSADYSQAVASGFNILIGDGYTNNFQGDIGMMSIYDVALTSSEVSEFFNATRKRYGV